MALYENTEGAVLKSDSVGGKQRTRMHRFEQRERERAGHRLECSKDFLLGGVPGVCAKVMFNF